MGYILKNTSGLLNVKLTDAARKNMAAGGFNISYFQGGDSEVCYDCIPNGDLSTMNVLMPEYNTQNTTAIPQKNRMEIKYPLFIDSTSGNTWGIPFNQSYNDNIFNSAAPRGFFTGDTGAFSAFTSSAYTMSSNWTVDLSTFASGNTLTVDYDFCDNSYTADTNPVQQHRRAYLISVFVSYVVGDERIVSRCVKCSEALI